MKADYHLFTNELLSTQIKRYKLCINSYVKKQNRKAIYGNVPL